MTIAELRKQREIIVLNLRGLRTQISVAREPINIASIEKSYNDQVAELRKVDEQIKEISSSAGFYASPSGNYLRNLESQISIKDYKYIFVFMAVIAIMALIIIFFG